MFQTEIPFVFHFFKAILDTTFNIRDSFFTRDMCVPYLRIHITGDMCFPYLGTHISRDMCFPYLGTHISRDMCFPYPGTHITRDMCFPYPGTHITRDMCFFYLGTHFTICSRVGETHIPSVSLPEGGTWKWIIRLNIGPVSREKLEWLI